MKDRSNIKEIITEYTFEKADYMVAINQSEELEKIHGRITQSCICRLFDEEKMDCPSEEYNAMILGKIWALFGNPDAPNMYEDFYSYAVSAKDKDGNILYLDVYQYAGMPSIGGPIGEGFENFEAAAAELKELIYSTEPTDYEWNGTYEDYSVNMKYYVKNGVAGAEDSFQDVMEEYYGFDGDELNKNLEKLFANMSADEINQWANEHQSMEEMIKYFEGK